jgi:hypothetical protein
VLPWVASDLKLMRVYGRVGTIYVTMILLDGVVESSEEYWLSFIDAH